MGLWPARFNAAASLGPPTMSPKMLLPSHAKGGTGARSRSGCQVLVDLNASLMISDHVTSAMPSPDSSMSHERIFLGRRRHFFGWWYTPPFQNQERQKAAFLAPPTMSPKLLLPSHARGGTGARSRSGCQVLAAPNTSHVTSAMPSPDSSMSHERIFLSRRRHFFGSCYAPHFPNQE